MKLDIGCGQNKREGFTGVDSIKFPGVDIVHDIRTAWPWGDSSVDEVHCSHFVEHLTARERVFFCNELYRVLKPDASAQIITPHWASSRAYGDMTHQWPPVSEFWFYYLDKGWRKVNAPHDDSEFREDGYSCDFNVTWGYTPHPTLNVRNAEYQQHAMQFWLESRQDTVANLKARK